MDLRYLKLKSSFEETLPASYLKEIYFHLSRALDLRETFATEKEMIVRSAIKNQTKLHFLNSIWIGKRNIDLFFPNLYSKNGFRGLAIEVDGDIHNHPLKMNRDNSKYYLVHKLNIALYTIENGDLCAPSFKELLKQLKTLPRLDSRGRKRVMRNIHLMTLAFNTEHSIVKTAFSEKQLTLLQKIKYLTRGLK